MNESATPIVGTLLLGSALLVAAILPFVFAKNTSCVDFLDELNLKTEELTFLECKQVEHAPAVLLEARYSVLGSDAAVVEDFLQRKFGLEELRFVCCGFEGKPAFYQNKTGDSYRVAMYSYDEFAVEGDLEDFSEFRVTVGKYLTLP